MNDDELRERLHAIPEPTTTIDVDAVVADARRRRRPKVIGTGVAVGAACLAFLAPVVVPGLLGPDPVTSTLQEAGVAEQGDSGAQPEAPAPAATDESAPTAGDEPDASTLQGGAEQGASGVAACSALPSREVAPGVALTFSAFPSGDAATLIVTNESDAAVTVRIGDVGIATVDGSEIIGTAAVDPGTALDAEPITIAPGARAEVDVPVDLDVDSCTPNGPVDGSALPVVALAIGDEADVVAVVLGDPTAS